MVLKNVICPGCGQQVSFTIESDEEITEVSLGGFGYDMKETCPSCDKFVKIAVE